MVKNMGQVDKIVRILIAAILGYLSYSGVITGTMGIVATAIGIVFLLTSLVSFCPLYSLFGISTCPVKK